MRFAGKSTLLRLLMGREKPQAGAIGLGEHNIAPNYFEQNQVRTKCLDSWPMAGACCTA